MNNIFRYTIKAKNHMGFTLAETLITLVIIGVVAALTVPNMIIKHQKEETVTRLKKFYSTLQQANNLSILDNGPINTWDYDGSSNTTVFSEKYIIPYLSVAKNCGYISSGKDACNFNYTYMDKSHVNQNWPGYRFYLNDGTLVDIHKSNENIAIWIDINGKRKPNLFGRDIFYFSYWFAKNTFEPFTVPADIKATTHDYLLGQYTYSCNKTHSRGYSCAALIMKDGWKISDDYPW